MSSSPTKSPFNRSTAHAFASSRLGAPIERRTFSSSRIGGKEQKFSSSRMGACVDAQGNFVSNRSQFPPNRMMSSSAMFMNNAPPMMPSMGGPSAAAFNMNRTFENLSMAEQQQAGLLPFQTLHQQQLQAFLVPDYQPDPTVYGCFQDQSALDEYNCRFQHVKTGQREFILSSSNVHN